jgi:hypothetical protein
MLWRLNSLEGQPWVFEHIVASCVCANHLAWIMPLRHTLLVVYMGCLDRRPPLQD